MSGATAVTDREVNQGELFWEIRAWSALPSTSGTRSSSPVIECAGHKWVIDVYPGGLSQATADYVSVYLRYFGTERCVETSFKFEIFNQTEASFRALFSTTVKLGQAVVADERIFRDRGRGRAILQRELAQSHCVGDSVCFKCFVKVFGGLSSTVHQASAWAPPRTLGRDLSALWADRAATGDGTLVVGSETFMVHKSIVGIRSRRLRASFYGGLADPASEVRITDFEGDVIQHMLHCIYTDECAPEALAGMPERLLEAADAFGIERMVYLCENELVRTLAVENAASRLQLAERIAAAAHLKEASIDFIHAHFDAVESTEGWARLLATPNSGPIIAALYRETHSRLKRPRESLRELLKSPDGVKRMRVDEMRVELQRRGLESFGLREELEERLAGIIRASGDADSAGTESE